ncbi:MAG: T9SS type A sorting domain-containing protein [Bacteroidota bacterium]
MKKLLLSIFTLVSVAAFAQKDLSIKLLTPMDGTEINSGKPFAVAFTVKNVGTTPILATDSFRIILALNNTLLSTLVGARAMNPGDSANLSPQGGGLPGVTFTSDVDTAFFIAAISFSDTVANVDPNDTNDVDFSYVKLRVIKTGLADLQAMASTVSAYPNPANAEFTITMKSTDATVEVMDITGKLVNSYSVTMGEAKMDVSNFNNGVYFYQIKTSANETVKSGKFTVSH